MIDYQQNQNWWLVVLPLQRRGCVWLGVVTSKMLIICFYRAQPSPPFGLWCELGLVLMVWTFRLFRITFTNLYITHVVWKRGEIFYSSYGFCVDGSLGMSEIIGCLKIRNALVISYLKKLNIILCGGWKLSSLVLFLVLRCGGRIVSCIWVSASTVVLFFGCLFVYLVVSSIHLVLRGLIWFC